MSKKKYNKARTEYCVLFFDDKGNQTGEVTRVSTTEPNNGIVKNWAKQEGISYNNWKLKN